MRAPQIVVLEADGWLVRQMTDFANEHAWLLRGTRSTDNVMSLVGDRRPSVLVIQVEPAEEKLAAFELIATINRDCSDVPVLAVSDVKMNDADRVAWTATLFDLGARYVLFPPITRPILEDSLSGLMTAAIQRAGLTANSATTSDKPKAKPSRAKPEEEVIDLADEDLSE